MCWEMNAIGQSRGGRRCIFWCWNEMEEEWLVEIPKFIFHPKKIRKKQIK